MMKEGQRRMERGSMMEILQLGLPLSKKERTGCIKKKGLRLHRQLWSKLRTFSSCPIHPHALKVLSLFLDENEFEMLK